MKIAFGLAKNSHCTQNPGRKVKTSNGLVTTAMYIFGGA